MAIGLKWIRGENAALAAGQQSRRRSFQVASLDPAASPNSVGAVDRPRVLNVFDVPAHLEDQGLGLGELLV